MSKKSMYKNVLIIAAIVTLLVSCDRKTVGEAKKEVTLNNAQKTTNVLTPSGTAPQYEPIQGGGALPAAHTLSQVKLTEFIDFGCVHCYNFNKVLPKVQNHFREKLITHTYIVSWRGESIVKAFYYAEQQGKGEDFKNLLFSLFHDSNIRNIGNPDIIITVLNELNIINDNNVDLDSLFNTPEVNAKFRKGEEEGRKYRISSTPTVIIEDAVKTQWDENNLVALIDYLLK